MTFIPAPVLGGLRLFLAALVWSTFTIPYVVLLKLNQNWGRRFGRFYLATWAKCLGHNVIVRGELSQHKPTLFVSNHSSYVDILVLSLLPGRFVAKQEVKGWPLLGFLATQQGTLYIERKRQSVEEGSKILEAPLKEGDNLILFPEGTTSDGCRILPFKSSFFDVAIKNDLVVQPVTVAYAGLNGMPMPRIFRQESGWFSEKIELLPHLWFISQLGRVQVVVTLHPPLQSHDFHSRKELAKTSESAVREGLETSFVALSHSQN
ncbi:1-acyl-sn-glycerol-3-phosphate acyltransferase [Candidatus Bealeia paramacronuclearis]|uniref:1-acyl-sn-glycerol-3-phosphate acyltransferase n=1 Tax=Candidatus Bealeia paramacronuclearis TaxID=1921001 RepID=A0ABZ2C568_9PROT|nr:1-acyl-sn-glycerol-3-phosphate acyltransferase [Candidatus Bealeia paramacronuclearis]